MKASLFVSCSLVGVLLVACGGASLPPAAPLPDSAPKGPSGPSGSLPAEGGCIGTIPAMPELELASDVPIAEKSVGKPGDGRLCEARAYRVKTTMTVHRIWDGGKPESRIGRWWALQKPSGSRDDYRRAYAICPEWSEANRSVTCKVRAGSTVMLGIGQSAKCAGGIEYPVAPTVQMFVPDPASAMEGCSEGQPFPEK